MPVGSDSRAFLVFAGALALALFVVPPRTDDLDWHLAVGRDVVREGAVPRANRYSFTAPDQPWIHHGWGGSVVLHLVERAGGFAALSLLAGLLFAASVTLVFLRSRSLPWTTAAALLLLASHALKPDALATNIAAALVWLLGDDRRSRWAPFSMPLWANVHGSFPVGLGLIAAADLGARRIPWRTAVAAVLCLTSPYGFAAFIPAWRYAFDPRLRSFLGELGAWQPPSGAAAVVLAISVVLAIVLAVHARPRPVDAVVAAIAAIAAWLAVRHVAVFAVVAGATVASTSSTPGSKSSRFFLVTGPALVAIVVVAFVVDPPGTPHPPFPTRLLAEPRPGRLLHPHAWGGALLAAGVPVAIDPRNDCYPPRVLDDFLSIHRGPRGLGRFVRWHRIDGALAPSGSSIDRGLRALGFQVSRESQGVVLLRR
ncbi:MAG: hypothetical protein HYY06_06945 [Deltaproteobacteria bacterium]|nr:hypothetical protein [Deltaproteobacteria bacterium]